MERDISSAVIRRMPRYYRYLEELRAEGVDRISSGDLSRLMNVTASQIRQDLNNFGGFGQQGYGYNVDYLHDEIAKILGLTRVHPVILIGVGNLGQAISNYVHFSRLSFEITGLFDINEKLKGREVAGTKIRTYDELPDFLKSHEVDIAALTIPKVHAQDVADDVIKYGVHAIWNFTHVDLVVPDDVVVENVHLSDSLMQLSYNLTEQEAETSSDEE